MESLFHRQICDLVHVPRTCVGGSPRKPSTIPSGINLHASLLKLMMSRSGCYGPTFDTWKPHQELPSKEPHWLSCQHTWLWLRSAPRFDYTSSRSPSYLAVQDAPKLQDPLKYTWKHIMVSFEDSVIQRPDQCAECHERFRAKLPLPTIHQNGKIEYQSSIPARTVLARRVVSLRFIIP